MIQETSKEESNKLLLYVVISLLVFSVLVIFDYLTYLFGAIILAFTFYPLYGRLNRAIKSPFLSALLCVVFVVVLLILPLVSMGLFVFTSGGVNYEQLEQSARILTKTFESWTGIAINLEEQIARAQDIVVSYLLTNPSRIFLTTVDIIIGLFIMTLGFYYFLVDGKNISDSTTRLVPLHATRKDYLSAKLSLTLRSLLIGTFLTAIVQGLVAGLSYFIFGVPNAALWTLVTMFVALIPVVGSALVWGPLALLQFLQGDLYSSIGLLAYNGIVTTSIDNIIRPALVPQKANIHPLLIIVGVLGGTKTLGFWGVIAGPLVLTLFVAAAKAYAYEETALRREVKKISKKEPGRVDKIYRSLKDIHKGIRR